MVLPAEEKEPQWVSPCWYLAPILGGLIGGIVAFFALRYRDRHAARYCILIGIISEIVFSLILYMIDPYCNWLPGLPWLEPRW